MQPIVYNTSLLLGTSAVSIGAGLQWGLSVGLMVLGALVIGLAIMGAAFSRKGA